MADQQRNWTPQSGKIADLSAVRDEILDCLLNTRGGTLDDQSAYLDDVLRRAGAADQVTWADLYRALIILKEDAIEAGFDPETVVAHAVKLQRILEQVDD